MVGKGEMARGRGIWSTHQAHDLKIAGSNPVPASLFESLTVRAGPQDWNSEKKECLAFPILVQVLARYKSLHFELAWPAP